MNSRYQQQDFRLIVGLRDGARGLQPAEVRTPIDGRTRITWLDGQGGTGGSSLVDPDSEETTDGEGGGGGGLTRPDGTDGGSLEGLPDGIDADFVPDEDYDVVPSVDEVFGGLDIGTYGTGERFQAVDCDTGDCVEINTSGMYAPPSGWDDLDGPIDDGWELGYYWRSAGLQLASSPAGVVAIMNDLSDSFEHELGSSCINTSNGVAYNVRQRSCNPFTGVCADWQAWRCTIDRVECGSSTEPYCSSTPPTPDSWPSDDCTQLVQDSEGRWNMHPKEPDRITKYEQGASLLSDICSGANRYQPLPGIDGGLVLWDYSKNIFRYKNPVTGVTSFGSSSSLNGVVASHVQNLQDGENAPFIKAVGYQD